MTSIFLSVFLSLVVSLSTFASDTAIYAHWKNGYPKTLTYYKIKHNKDSYENTVRILKATKVKYFDREGEEISKKDFDFFYSVNQRADDLDSLWEAKRQVYTPDTSAKLYIPIGGGIRSIPFRFPNAKDGSKIYRQNDSVIQGQTYTVLEFVREPQNENGTKYKFSGALRVNDYKIYYFDGTCRAEEITTDFKSMLKRFSEKATDVAEVSAVVVNKSMTGIKKGTEKASAFILATLILMLR